MNLPVAIIRNSGNFFYGFLQVPAACEFPQQTHHICDTIVFSTAQNYPSNGSLASTTFLSLSHWRACSTYAIEQKVILELGQKKAANLIRFSYSPSRKLSPPIFFIGSGYRNIVKRCI
jgi:hypothetical protein